MPESSLSEEEKVMIEERILSLFPEGAIDDIVFYTDEFDNEMMEVWLNTIYVTYDTLNEIYRKTGYKLYRILGDSINNELILDFEYKG